MLSRYPEVARLLSYAKSKGKGEGGIQEISDIILHPYRYTCFIARTTQGKVISENIPSHETADFDFIKEVVRAEIETREKMRIEEQRRKEEEREKKEREMERRKEGSRQHAMLKREWSDKRDQMRRQVGDYKLKVSLSFSITGTGIGIGKMLG